MLMGQAKQRGTKEQREAQAKAKVEALKPLSIVCNHCQADITEVHTMDARGIQGVDAAFAGMCSCGHTTWAIAGNPNAVADFAESMQSAVGEEAIVGSMPVKRRMHAYINETRQDRVLLDEFPCAECGARILLDNAEARELAAPVRHAVQFGDCVDCGAAHMIVSASTKDDCVRLEPVFAEMKRSFERSGQL